MSSLYQRGTTWWAKAYLNGQAVRFSLRTKDKREARRRLRSMTPDLGMELMPARAKSHTWDTAAAELLATIESLRREILWRRRRPCAP